MRKSTANLRCFGIAPKAAKDRAAERAEENPFAAHLQQQHGERRDDEPADITRGDLADRVASQPQTCRGERTRRQHGHGQRTVPQLDRADDAQACFRVGEKGQVDAPENAQRYAQEKRNHDKEVHL